LIFSHWHAISFGSVRNRTGTFGAVRFSEDVDVDLKISLFSSLGILSYQCSNECRHVFTPIPGGKD
jgi:hypothetical protein